MENRIRNMGWNALSEDRDVPWLHIHVMTEFDYCPRAGVIAYESGPEDAEVESGVENLDYLPMYFLTEIDREINSRYLNVYQWMGVVAFVGFLTVVGGHFLAWYYYICGAIGLAIAGTGLFSVAKPFVTLVFRRVQAARAAGRTPNLDSPEDETIGWWEIQKEDFEVRRSPDSMVDPELRLRGTPWRILSDGEVIIPVFKHRTIEDLHRQHYARIAGYCRLIEQSVGARSPFGLILQSGTYRAIVIKNTVETQQTLRTVLHRARSAIRDYVETGRKPPSPEPDLSDPDAKHPCWKCPIGKPRLHVPGETELVCNGERRPIVVAFPTRLGNFHSKCGDRFGEQPPHKLLAAYRRFSHLIGGEPTAQKGESQLQ